MRAPATPLALLALAIGCSAPPGPPVTSPASSPAPLAAPGAPEPPPASTSQWRPAGTSDTLPAAPAAGFAPMSGQTIPPLREAGNRLRVDHPPVRPARPFRGRLRTHTDGVLSAGGQRTWVGPPVPAHVPLEVDDGVELFLLDPQPDGSHLAFYREPYNLQSCTLSGRSNCRYRAVHFGADGQSSWGFPLDPLLSTPEGLEIQDIQLLGGVLYFNEACQSYARESAGRCSALVAVDPVAARVLWRTLPLTSNNVFVPLGAFLLVGYGFTAEADRLSLVRRSDGAIVSRLPLASAHSHLTPVAPDRVRVELSNGQPFEVQVEKLDSASPRLVQVR